MPQILSRPFTLVLKERVSIPESLCLIRERVRDFGVQFRFPAGLLLMNPQRQVIEFSTSTTTQQGWASLLCPGGPRRGHRFQVFSDFADDMQRGSRMMEGDVGPWREVEEEAELVLAMRIFSPTGPHLRPR